MEKLKKIFGIKSLRDSLLFVLAMLLLFRLLAHVPVPGVNVANLEAFFEANQVLGLLNIFSGGTMQSFSVVMLGVGPYITSSIIFQLLNMVIPRLEELSKEGEHGRAKINQYTRLLTVPLAALQAYGYITLLRQSPLQVLPDLTAFNMFTIIVVATAGSMFLTWIGELITEKKVGNGISLLIFAAIVSGFPTTLSQIFATFDATQIPTLISLIALALITVVGVIFITEGQRNIPISYARQVRGTRIAGGVKTHLPLRVNMAGVIPIIFAISLVLFPPLIAQFFVRAKTDWLATFAQWTIEVFQNQLIYGLLYFLLVFGFTYFYTSVVVHPDQMAENLQRQGAFIPGVRPGTQTRKYLDFVITRITFTGATFLAAIAVLPLIVQAFTGTNTLLIGGMSLLIIVSVAIEAWKQIDAQITMHSYDKVY